MLQSAVRGVTRHGAGRVAKSASLSSPVFFLPATVGIGNSLNHQRRSFLQDMTKTSPSSMAGTGSDAPKEVSNEADKILRQCSVLYDSLTVLNDKLGSMAIPPPTDRATSLPFCLLVGNHSSGKSSFINYLLERNIQTAGVAPTDDTFTVIAPGETDMDADGPTLIGNPDLGFGSLRQFGPTLIHHSQLKIRSSPLSFMLVDSPGMIDAPNNIYRSSSRQGSSAMPMPDKSMDRGYDFPGVVRWLAQRADIVLLFFDPDKPGTTGETMNVLLNSLSGMDHKLLIILNKADQFHKIHDFARAYGSLCWNLSKVIPRKDLPPIFTMCLPTTTSKNGGQLADGSDMTTFKTTLSASLSDLEYTRDEVVDQVKQAPKRRVDNVITNLYDSTSMLILFSKIWNDVAGRYRRSYLRCRFQELGWTIASAGSLGGMNHFELEPVYQGGFLGMSILGVGGLVWYDQYYLARVREDLTSDESLSLAFQRTHTRQVQDGDEFIASLWQRIRDSLQLALKSAFDNSNGGLLTTASSAELQQLTNLLDSEIPQLRRQASEIKH